MMQPAQDRPGDNVSDRHNIVVGASCRDRLADPLMRSALIEQVPGAMPTTDSVGHMLKVIDGLTLEDNGRFIDFNGEAMPW